MVQRHCVWPGLVALADPTCVHNFQNENTFIKGPLNENSPLMKLKFKEQALISFLLDEAKDPEKRLKVATLDLKV